MARPWPEHGQNIARTPPGHGQNMARTWPAHGQNMARMASWREHIWPEHSQNTARHGQNMARTQVFTPLCLIQTRARETAIAAAVAETAAEQHIELVISSRIED